MKTVKEIALLDSFCRHQHWRVCHMHVNVPMEMQSSEVDNKV